MSAVVTQHSLHIRCDVACCEGRGRGVGMGEGGQARAIFKGTARAIAGVGSDAALRCAPADTQGSQGSLLHFTATAAQAEHMQGGIKREELLNECLKD